MLLARAEQARDVLPEGLEARGLRRRRAAGVPDRARGAGARRARAGAAGEVDAITFTSSSTVTGFCDLVGPLPDPQPLVVSIGPVTSRTAVERGIRVDVEADPHSIDGLVDALLEALGGEAPN